MLRDVILALHVVVGAAGLVAGPVAVRMVAARDLFHWLVLAVCASAVALVPFDRSGLWFFVPVSIASYGFALLGYRAGARRGRLIRGYGGAYVALWTAVLVVGAPAAPLVWIVPALIGVPLIERRASVGHAEQ